jgi:hypothetical protein
LTWDPGDRQQALDKLERIMFRNRIQGIGVIDERSFASWAREIYTDGILSNEILTRFINHINIAVPAANMVNYFNGLYGYERGAKGFHRWHTLKYFLFEYEQHLKDVFNETNDKVSLSDYESTTIEHVIPQEYDLNWAEQIAEVSCNLTEQHSYHGIKVVLNTLGNLTILKDGKNSSLGNRGWGIKRDRFQTGSYNEIDIARNENWNRETISKRGEDMLRFLVTKIHGLNFQSSDIENILFSNPSICSAIRDGKTIEQQTAIEDTHS